METRNVDMMDVWYELQRGVPEAVVMKNFNLSRTDFFVITEKLKKEGLLTDGQRCPACGFFQIKPFSDCPKCGIVTNKFGRKAAQKPVTSSRISQLAEKVWNPIASTMLKWFA